MFLSFLAVFAIFQQIQFSHPLSPPPSHQDPTFQRGRPCVIAVRRLADDTLQLFKTLIEICFDPLSAASSRTLVPVSIWSYLTLISVNGARSRRFVFLDWTGIAIGRGGGLSAPLYPPDLYFPPGLECEMRNAIFQRGF